MEEMNKALDYNNKALPIFESLGEVRKIEQVHEAIANDCRELHRYKEALEHGLKAEELAIKSGNKGAMLTVTIVLGATYVAMAEDRINTIPPGFGSKKEILNKAILQLQKGEAMAKEMQAPLFLIQLYDRLSLAYKLSGRMEDAYNTYVAFVQLRDSSVSNDTRLKISALETKRESDLKEKQIEINKSQAREKRNEQIFFLTGIVLLVGIVFLVVRNNRKQKRTNARLAESNRIIAEEKEKSDKLAAELEELNAVKDKLFSAISHDLRSPLGRITNMLYMMQRGNMTEEKLKERTTEFLSAMQQTMQMLDNLLYWATAQMKGLALTKTNIRISELVDENLELMKPEASVKKIELIDKIGETANALADANMTRLVLRNLISNAIKFTPENGSITITAETLADKVRVQVKDTGVGMSSETIQALYANKQVESRSGTQKEKGFGIGLQLCKDFIEQNGGTLEIVSEPGQGSTFSFTLPAS